MKKHQEHHHIVSDINSFDKDVSIYKILFQDRATSLLKHIADKISIDRYEQVNFKLPSILLSGGEGKELIARAFANSMCSDFEIIGGEGLGVGGDSGSLLSNSDTETIYYVNQADKLSRYSVSQTYKYLTCSSVQYQNRFGGEDLTVEMDNKLFIFGVNDSKKLSHDLYKTIDYHCYLQNYSVEQTEILLEQRLRWCGLDYDEQVPAIVAHNSRDISSGVRQLSLAYLVARGNGKASKITVKDVQIGIGLNKQGGIGAPPIPDDIPF